MYNIGRQAAENQDAQGAAVYYNVISGGAPAGPADYPVEEGRVNCSVTDRKRILFIAALVVAAVSLMSCSSATLHPVNMNKGGVAIKGYDTVAYFTEGKPVKGDEHYSFQWKGAKWLFSSKENQELFMGDPEKFAPQYGGY